MFGAKSSPIEDRKDFPGGVKQLVLKGHFLARPKIVATKKELRNMFKTGGKKLNQMPTMKVKKDNGGMEDAYVMRHEMGLRQLFEFSATLEAESEDVLPEDECFDQEQATNVMDLATEGREQHLPQKAGRLKTLAEVALKNYGIDAQQLQVLCPGIALAAGMVPMNVGSAKEVEAEAVAFEE